MLKRFKKVLGIEGLKISVFVHPIDVKFPETINGSIELNTLTDVIVQNIEIKLIEKYERGRKDNKLIDEMVIGQTVLKGKLKLKKDERKNVDFELKYTMSESPMDALEKENLFYKGFVKLAKLAKGVKSSHRIEATAKVKGTVLDAVDNINIEL